MITSSQPWMRSCTPKRGRRWPWGRVLPRLVFSIGYSSCIQYTGKDVDGLETAVDKYLLQFIDLIRRKYISTASELRPLDFARRISFFAMDFTTDIAFGSPWGCLAQDEDVGKWFETSELLLPNVIMVSTIPWLAKLFAIPIIGRLVMPSDKDQTGAGRLIR
jgi:hypothetical protein